MAFDDVIGDNAGVICGDTSSGKNAIAEVVEDVVLDYGHGGLPWLGVWLSERVVPPQRALRGVLFHQFGEIAKEVEAIVRTWRGLRVALDGKNGQFAVVQALDAIVVEVEASDFETARQ